MPSAIAGEGDDVRDTGFFGDGNDLSKPLFNLGVILDAIQGGVDFAAPGIAHAADESVPPRYLPLLGLKQIDGFEADVSGVGAEFVERDLW